MTFARFVGEGRKDATSGLASAVKFFMDMTDAELKREPPKLIEAVAAMKQAGVSRATIYTLASTFKSGQFKPEHLRSGAAQRQVDRLFFVTDEKRTSLVRQVVWKTADRRGDGPRVRVPPPPPNVLNTEGQAELATAPRLKRGEL